MSSMSRNHSRTLTILFFGPVLEYPAAGGPQLRVVNSLRALNQVSRLHVTTSASKVSLSGPEGHRFFSQICASFAYTPTSLWHSKNKMLDKFAGRVRRLLAPFFALIDVIFIIQHAKRVNADVLWIAGMGDYAFQIFLLLRIFKPRTKIVSDTEAIHSRFFLREVPIINNPLRKLFVWLRGNQKVIEERCLAKMADAVTGVSKVDADYFRALTNDSSKIDVFSNVVFVDDYTKSVTTSIKLQPNSALLIGSFGHKNSPMDRAADWTVNQIMPLVWRAVPDAHLYIIGRNSEFTQASANSDRVTVVGRVPSMAPYFKQAAMTIVPLEFESGTRFKILETGASSLPCVSTTLGAEGLNVTPGQDLLVADDTTSFADAMINILSDRTLAKKLGQNLHLKICDHYGVPQQIREAQQILSKLFSHD